MAEYIERKAALAEMEELFHKTDPNGEEQVGFLKFHRIVRTLPAADVAPVAHGEWVLERDPNGKPYCFHCSVCDGDFHHIGITVKYDYCPNCGAKIDGGNHET